MNKRIFFISIIIFILLIMTQCEAPGNKYPKELDKLVPEASLIFKGKILLLHTVTTDEIDPSNSGVVAVTNVIEAPQSFPNITGQQVTIRFSDINDLKVGDEKMFFTDPYWIGESIGVREIGSVKNTDDLYENKEILSFIKQARSNQDDEKLRKILKDAKLVVTGRVIKINEPKGNNLGNTIAIEHNPEWKEAEIQIDEVIKGKAENKTLRILFASGKDVMFFRSPKFKDGDEGIFIIHPTDSLTVKIFRNNNMVIDPSGFIKGKEKTIHIKSLLK